MKILLANPRGFCAGVDRAIDIVERAHRAVRRADLRAPRGRAQPVRRRPAAQPRRGVRRGTRRGAGRRDRDLQRARRARRPCRTEARRRGLRVFDATCPLVTKVHMEVTRYAREGRDVILIGHEGHPEVEGTMGQFDESQGGRICLVEDVGGRRAARGARPGRGSASSRRPRCRWTTRPRCWRRCSAASRPCARRARKTSATPRRTARTR